MNRFFNIIAGKESCLILLYGNIGDYDAVRAGDIARELIEAERQYHKIDVRVNSYGGDVLAGIAIFNALRNSKADITIYIDGVAASIASVIVACGKPVQMSKYAKLMIHNVSGGAYGTIQDIERYAEAMKDVENTLVGIYSERTGMNADDIRSNYFDGNDHWLSADDALELGFIDGIYDADPIPLDSTPEQIYSIFNNRIKTNHFKNNKKMFENLKKRKMFANCADEAAAETVIADLEAKAAKVEQVEADNTALKAENDAYKAKEAADHDAEIDNMVETAHTEERITADEVPTFKNVLKVDFENGKKLLDARKGKKRVMQNLGNPGEPAVSAWDTRMVEINDNLKK